jgi:hypothetical protein
MGIEIKAIGGHQKEGNKSEKFTILAGVAQSKIVNLKS